ncbi:LPS translocon maturation chaperone LptM [Mesorhizobium xinjiangense]|uniref:LPS translocon maturation chaperone LptM n=1 Tax=Mesorhizobium xinjiangense TaxID=2678685 RepID=UPI001F26F0A5|nr:lipoprotein [Mesorhizobium xinjiangense]
MAIRKEAAAMVVVALVALTVSACGRKGDLLTPSEAAAEARKEAEREGQPLPPAEKRNNRSKRFFLDPLIE